MSPVNIVINKCSVEYKEKIKYLGYWFQSNLKPNAHIDHALSKGYAGLRSLYPLLDRRSGLNEKIKCKLYTAIIRPVLTYAIPLWCVHTKTSSNKLKVLENKCLRLAINADKRNGSVKLISDHNLHLKSKTPYLKSFMEKIATSSLKNTRTHSNPIINSLGNFTDEQYMTMRRKPSHYLLTLLTNPE